MEGKKHYVKCIFGWIYRRDKEEGSPNTDRNIY
jgi:hypothetical protein